MGEARMTKANQPSRLFNNKVVHLLYGSQHIWVGLSKTQAKINVLKMICKLTLSGETLLECRCDNFLYIPAKAKSTRSTSVCSSSHIQPWKRKNDLRRLRLACNRFTKRSQPPARAVVA